ncbi:MAG: recombination protein RecR [Bacteriovoracaceae bacterium]|nr:recombination protein RecR [Bacteriovoracaceae bacterium]
MELPTIIQDVVEHLSRLPGVGGKTAQRYALAMAKWHHEDVTSLGRAIGQITELRKCIKCGMFSDDDLCHICDSTRAGSSVLCVVENISDCIAIEKSGTFRGLYYILGGVLNPLMGIGPDELGLDRLIRRIKEEEIGEVILAINPSVEGDATCSYINQIMPEDSSAQRIGFGIPMGGSLEYLDAMTISKALENKKKM